ncbi:MAG: trigger factor [Oligoflexales bacterium]|nr:trigger factor [Oligoflexales bacterium]
MQITMEGQSAMKAHLEEISSVQRKVNVELGADAVNKEFDKAFRKLQKQAQIKGFRPGKAPLSMLKKVYGERVAHEISETLINESLRKAFQDLQLRPLSWPMVDFKEAPKPDLGFSFTAIVDVMPQFEVTGYKDLTVSCDKYVVNEESVTKELTQLQRRHGSKKSLASGSKAQVGNLATISHHVTGGSHSHTEEDQAVAGLTADKLTVTLGQKELIEDLDRGIVGMSVGEEKMIHVNVPQDYQDSELAGRHLHFHVKLDALEEVELPTLNDEFAKDLEASSLEDLKEKIRENLDRVAERMRRQSLENRVVESLLQTNSFDVPPSMIDQVIDGMIGEQNWPSEDVRKRAQQDQRFRDSLRTEAEKRAKTTLMLWKVAEKEALQVTDTDIEERLKQLIPQAAEQPELLAKYRQQFADKIKDNMQLEKSMAYIISAAKVSEIPVNL